MIKPSQYCIYKKSSALRLSIKKPSSDYETGFAFLEFAKFLSKNGDNNNYDWNNKIGIKLNLVDLSKLSYALQKGIDCEIFHKHNDTSKIIKLTRNSGNNPYFFSVLLKKNGQEDVSISTPLSSDECYTLLLLFEKSIPSILGW